MKLTKNRINKPSVQKRWKLMFSVFVALLGASYLGQYVQDAMMEELYGVNAAEETFDDPIVTEEGMHFSKEEDAIAAQATKSDKMNNGDNFKWQDTEYTSYVYLKRQQGWIEEFFDGEEGNYCYR